MEKQEILMESGTNEFEFIEFSIGDIFYGINVAKVREVVNATEPTQLPNAHPYVDGVFALRGKLMPLVNLARSLHVEDVAKNSKIIVSELNAYYVGFKVDDVTRIHRISWMQMEPAPQITNSERVIGVVKLEGRLILLLDFEKILAEINPEINRRMTDVPEAAEEVVEMRKEKTILIAEDSTMLRQMIVSTLQTAGYHVLAMENGQEAWDALERMNSGDEPIEEKLQLVVTDIEMPQMDGHHLIKRMKETSGLQDLPVIVFSSLISPEMIRKGEALGAYYQITKPDMAELIRVVDAAMTTLYPDA